MTALEAIESLEGCEGTIAEKLAKLLATIQEIDTPVTNTKHTPRCACGVELTVWYGRHSGCTIVYHPLGIRPCPRARYSVFGATPEDAIKIYVETAPDIESLHAIHDDDPDPFADEFN